MTIDPNWLLSTTAQSGAALVAIIGAFLVSRLIGLAAEREALARRQRDVSGRRRLAADEYERRRADRLKGALAMFYARVVDDVVKARGKVDVEAIVADNLPAATSPDELRPTLESLVATTTAAFEAIEAAVPERLISVTVDEARACGVQVVSEDEDVYERVAAEISHRRRGRTGIPSGLPTIAPAGESWRLRAERQDVRIREEERARASLDLVEAELSTLEDELQRLISPPFVTSGLVTLTYFAAVGVGLPLVLLSRRPVPSTATWRLIVVVLFLTGLVALLGYLFAVAASLKRTAPADNGSAD